QRGRVPGERASAVVSRSSQQRFRTCSGDQYGGTVDLVRRQICQGLVGFGEVVRPDADGERKAACQSEEFLAVGPGVGGDGADLPFLEQVSLIVENGD